MSGSRTVFSTRRLVRETDALTRAHPSLRVLWHIVHRGSCSLEAGASTVLAHVHVRLPVPNAPGGKRWVPVVFGVTASYPFRPPSLRVNGHPYHTLLASRVLRDTARATGNGCPCCESLLCRPWCPANKLETVLAEVEMHLDTLFRGAERLMARTVVRQCLFPLCPLDAYL